MHRAVAIFAFITLVGAEGEVPRIVEAEGQVARIEAHPCRPKNETKPVANKPPQTTAAIGIAATYPVGINYYGGPVMTGATPVHIVFYGAWSATRQSIVKAFISDMSTMKDVQTVPNMWFNLERTYSSNGLSTGTFTSSVTLGTTYSDTAYSYGKSLGPGAIWNIVAYHINGGRLPNSLSAIYVVLTDSTVSESSSSGSSFCTNYCGWHSYSSQKYKYSFVGNAARCMGSCAPQTVSPNGDAGVDATLSVLAHEVVETLSDPLLNAYYDSAGNENGDKCAWTFGTYKLLSGYYYNMVGSSGRKYFVQQNWNAKLGKCQTSTNAAGTASSALLNRREDAAEADTPVAAIGQWSLTAPVWPVLVVFAFIGLLTGMHHTLRNRRSSSLEPVDIDMLSPALEAVEPEMTTPLSEAAEIEMK